MFTAVCAGRAQATPSAAIQCKLVAAVDMVDSVDSVEYTSSIESQESPMSGVSRASAADRSVQALLASIADVSGQAKRVAKLPQSAFRDQVAQLGRQWRGAIRLVQEQEAYLAKIREMLASQALGSEQGRSRRKAKQTAPAGESRRSGREAKQLEKLALAGTDSVRAGMLKMVQRQELLPSSEFAERMNWSKQALSKALTSGRVFYADVNGERYYPAFFLEDRYGRRQVQTVSKALGTLPGATKLLYLQTPKASLAGMTPLEALAKGRVGQARAAAEAFAQG
jgi:hypothetical protein